MDPVITATSDSSVWVVAAPWAAAIVALGGVLIATSRERRSVHRAWIRDHRLAAYTDYLVQSELTYEAVLQTVALIRSGEYDSAADMHEKTQPQVTELETTRSRISLLGPPPVSTACSEHFDELHLWYMQAFTVIAKAWDAAGSETPDRPSGDDIRPFAAEVDQLLDEFRAKASIAVLK